MPPAFSCSYAIEWVTPAGFHRAKPPVSGAASVPDEVRNAAAGVFSRDTIKRRFLFSAQPIGAPHKSPAKRVLWGRGGATERYEGCPLPQGVPNIAQFDPTTNGGFEAAGLPRHSRPDGKKVLKPPVSTGTPAAPRDGAHIQSPAKGNISKTPRAVTAQPPSAPPPGQSSPRRHPDPHGPCDHRPPASGRWASADPGPG